MHLDKENYNMQFILYIRLCSHVSNPLDREILTFSTNPILLNITIDKYRKLKEENNKLKSLLIEWEPVWKDIVCYVKENKYFI